MVEIPADMTARDVCQLLVYKSHCLDDNAWTLVEHHPILGLGEIMRLVHPGLTVSQFFLSILNNPSEISFCKDGHQAYFHLCLCCMYML